MLSSELEMMIKMIAVNEAMKTMIMVMMNRVEAAGHWAESKVSLAAKCHTSFPSLYPTPIILLTRTVGQKTLHYRFSTSEAPRETSGLQESLREVGLESGAHLLVVSSPDWTPATELLG